MDYAFDPAWRREEQNEEDDGGHGGVVWITGLSSAGKTTLAGALTERLLAHGVKPVLLDGNEIRDALDNPYGFDRESRRRMAFIYARLCRVLAEQGHLVICATISLFHEVHSFNRAHIPGYVEVFLDVPLEELARRDTRSVYANKDGSPAVGIGVTAEFPKHPDLTLHNERGTDVAEMVERVLTVCRDRNLLNRRELASTSR